MARARWKAGVRVRRPHRRRKLQQVDFREHGRAPWGALTVSGQGGAFGSLTAAALRAGASADSGSLSWHQNFFCKNVFTQRLPLYGTEPFLGKFLGGGMTEISKRKVPLPGGPARRK